MQKGFLCLIILLSLNGRIFAQEKSCEKDCSCEVSGIIIDADNNQPIAFASIQIKGTSKGTTSDEKGQFTITNLCESEFDVIVNHLGYKQVLHHHDSYHQDLLVELASDQIILESIVVEDKNSKMGLSSSTETTLSSKDLANTRNESLGEVLTNIAGVSTLKTGQNVVKPIIHGLHSNRVLIINNGIRHESQDWGASHAPEVDPSMADRLTIIKGAGAVKYGPNALGGVILVDPPRLELHSHLHGEMQLTGESNGRALDGNLLLQQGYENLAWSFQASGRKQGDLHAPDYQLTSTGMEELSLATGASYHRKNITFNVYASHVQQKLGVLRSSVTGSLEDLSEAINASEPEITEPFSYTISTPNQEVQHNLAKLESIVNLNNSQLLLNYGFQLNKRKEFDVRRGSNNEIPSIDLELTTHTVEAEWIHPEWSGWSGSFGAQGLYQDNNNLPGTNTIPFIPNFNISRAGIYFTESKEIGKSIVEVGVRYDYQTQSVRGRDNNNEIFRDEFNYHAFSGIVGLTQSLSPSTEMRMNLATAWRPPNIAELYSFGKHRATIDYGLLRYQFENNILSAGQVLLQDNASIQNELGIKWIGSLQVNKRAFRLELSPFINLVKNYIYNRPQGVTNSIRGAFPYFIYVQTDALLSGMDITTEIRHNKKLTSNITGNLLWARDIKNDDIVFGIPANQLSYSVAFQDKLLGRPWKNELTISYTFKQFQSPRVIDPQRFVDDNTFNPFLTNQSIFDFAEVPNGYGLLNWRTSIELKNWEIALKINNLLNQSYREYTDLLRYFADQPGTNLIFTVSHQL